MSDTSIKLADARRATRFKLSAYGRAKDLADLERIQQARPLRPVARCFEETRVSAAARDAAIAASRAPRIDLGD